MHNRSVIYFFGFIIAIVSFLVFDYSARRDYLRKTSQERDIATIEAPVSIETVNPVNDIGLRARFLIRFRNFVIRMDALSDDPDQSEELLKSFSQTINANDVVALNNVLNDFTAKNDERTLALELMVMNQDFTSHNFISNFVQNENFNAAKSQEFEISLRTQAIEGLTLFTDKKLVRKNLENLRIRTRHAFLHDRAGKAIQYLSNSNLEGKNANAEASSP